MYESNIGAHRQVHTPLDDLPGLAMAVSIKQLEIGRV
jgi:hypothetical protein